jgi:Uma2 family endonuclease
MMPEPVLLIEILSPGNEATTRSNIWTYTTIPSVQEILSVRSDRIEAEVLRRDAACNWPLEPLTIRPPGNLELTSIGFVCQTASPYRTAGLAE